MKQLLYTLIISSALLTVACSKSALDYKPNDQLASVTFWKSENDVRLALNGCYGYLANSYNNAYDDGASDNAYCQYPWESNATRIASGDINATLDAGYNSRYQFIRRYNYFLDNVDKAQLDDALSTRFKLECRVLRAITYFDLIRTFGDVPLFKTGYADPLETAVSPTPQTEVLAFIISELKEAAATLPANYAGALLLKKAGLPAELHGPYLHGYNFTTECGPTLPLRHSW
ncbi:RagB/SusD family nutrient uptake outer membrane protein [Niabella hibiscisoli]|uniref:RagB/SusD family nutrient uptake outer membrane protein n=1 Tax=Niabella hibiscisoli TaxID=1825928 RepID=UPI001F113FD9|nr:RagB/SusD family nutrient uptake outer membrane protein [Niabella hibiscisoli]MCH5719253.1 RagB/SusD family nutrient uptake outer membrane protein [Niabella hibiscisoli]